MCGRLLKAMYGKRDAAQSREYAYAEELVQLGFRRGKATPCAFYHPARNLRLVVHGDDFTLLGHEPDLKWYRRGITAVVEVNFRGRIGPAATYLKAIRILDRVVQWTPEGFEYEADQRHAELIIQGLGLEGGKPVSSPGCRRDNTLADDTALPARDATTYRAFVARGNYLSQDRSDISFSVKELCRSMATPTEGDWTALKRLGRYLVAQRRSVTRYPYQGMTKRLDVWVDTDYAGCRRTRKSTSGGQALLGSRPIKGWSVTQAVIALSSGEAAYYGIVKGSTVGLGLSSVLRDLGHEAKVIVHKVWPPERPG